MTPYYLFFCHKKIPNFVNDYLRMGGYRINSKSLQTNQTRRRIKKMSATILLISMITATVISHSEGQLCNGVYVEPDKPKTRGCGNKNIDAIKNLTLPWHAAAGLSESCLPSLAVEKK